VQLASVDVTSVPGQTIVTVSGWSPSVAPPAAGDRAELITFTRDNVVPLVLSGPLEGGGGSGVNGFTAGKETTAPTYRIKLCDMVLPNLGVVNGYGGQIYNYPYIYVTLMNDQTTTFSDLMYSNNASAKSAMFKVVTSQFKDKVSFLFFDGGEIEQVVRLNLEQNLRVMVTLPDGSVLRFHEEQPSFFFPDKHYPIRSNPLTQTSFTFKIVRE
jgi:hypothetical protein